jgi:hypothetical protein
MRAPQDFQDAYLTFMVTIDTFVTELSSLKQSIIHLRQHLKKRNTTINVATEFIDHRAVHGSLTLPIRHHETEVLDHLLTVQESVYSEISSRKVRRLSIDLLNRGLLEDRCVPTVVITSPSASSPTWRDKIIPSIKKCLAPIGPVFEIEILCARSLL